VKIIKKVQVKQIVTEKSKKALHHRFAREKMRLEQECQQLLFEKKKLQHKFGGAKQEVARRFLDEIRKRKEKIATIDFQMEQLEMIELGSEIVEREVEALVEVQEGTHWDELMKEQSIVIKDGVVIRIDR
jgi:hypothetical protein